MHPETLLMAEALYSVMGWTVSPQNSYVEALTLSTSECDCIEDRAFKEVTKVKWVNNGGP